MLSHSRSLLLRRDESLYYSSHHFSASLLQEPGLSGSRTICHMHIRHRSIRHRTFRPSGRYAIGGFAIGRFATD